MTEQGATSDVLVIGAGVSGLAAAAQLARAGLRVQVLEARERIGGRVHSATAGGVPVDLGGQWIGPTQHRVQALVARHGIATWEQPQVGDKLLERGDRLSRYHGTIPALPLAALAELQLRLWQLALVARRVDPAAPWRAPQSLDEASMAQWIADHCWSQTVATMVRLAIHAVFAAEPGEISQLQFFHYVRAAGGLMPLLDVEGGAQQTRIHGGAATLAEALAGEARQAGARIRTAAPVVAVRRERGMLSLEAGGRRYRARRLIVAMAPADARRIDFGPLIGPERRALMDAQRPGSAIKCIAVYERPFWRDAGLCGEMVSDGEVLRMCFDGTPPDAERGVLVGFLLGEAARRWHAAGPEARRRAVLDQLARLFGPAAARPLAWAEGNWLDERWTAGCYTGLFAPGGMRKLSPWLRRADGPIHWAGTETATRWCGYIDGAIEAGERAAQDVLAES